MISSVSALPTLQQFVENSIKSKGWTRRQLVQLMGYSNIAKGLRRLDRFSQTLEAPDSRFVSKLQIALETDPTSLEKAMSVTKDAIEDNAKKTFTPHLVICVDFHPQPWFAAQFVQAECTIKVSPDIRHLSFLEEMEMIISLYKERSEKLSFKERIIGFRYQRSYDSCLMFDKKQVCTEILLCNAQQPAKYFGNKVLDILIKNQSDGLL